MEFFSFFESISEFLANHSEIEKIVKLVISAFLGFFVGIERRRYNKAVGFRTCMIITSSATLLTIFSLNGFSPFIEEGGINDPSRLSAQILSGIGFIGAGVIIRDSHSNKVSGLTTAATIWMLTGIGIGVGISQYALSIAATVILFITLSSKTGK